MLATTTQILHFLASTGPWLILPLSVIEGPIVTILAGVLAERGHLDWQVAVVLLILGDLIGDLIFYAVGRGVLHASANTRLGRWFGRWFGFSREKAQSLTGEMNRRATHLLLVGKWTHALGAVVLVAAGSARVKLPRFLLINLIGTIPKTAVFFLLGYFAGHYLEALSGGLAYAPLVLVPLGAALIALVIRRRREPAA